MHVNSTELMNAELNLLMDTPVVTSASCHPAGFPHTRRHIFHSAWPGPQALPPASSPCWVITTIPFAPPFYTINCEAGKQDLNQCIGIYMLLKKCYNRAKEYQNWWTEAWSNLRGSEVKEYVSLLPQNNQYIFGWAEENCERRQRGTWKAKRWKSHS